MITTAKAITTAKVLTTAKVNLTTIPTHAPRIDIPTIPLITARVDPLIIPTHTPRADITIIPLNTIQMTPEPVKPVVLPPAQAGTTTQTPKVTTSEEETEIDLDLYDTYDYDEPIDNEVNLFWPKPRSFEVIREKEWEKALHNGWYKWIWYTVKEITSNECLVCSESPATLPVVVPEKYSFEECARVQQKECREGRFIPRDNSIGVYALPMCAIQCRLIYGSKKIHNLISKLPARANNLCKDFEMTTAQNGPPTDYAVDRTAEYECFASGGFIDTTQYGPTTDVGNTTVRCNVTWVLSWFPHVNITPAFVPRPVWFENPVTLDQTCENITMTVPSNQFLGVQSTAVADSYWMCGDNILLNTLPPRWIGLCTLVRMKVPLKVIYEGVQDILQLKDAPEQHARTKRSFVNDPLVYLDEIGVPRGIPEEFKARNEIKAGLESILIWITPNKNVNWINYVYYNQQRFINYTNEALTALGEQLHATSKMALQNRQALDWLLAEKTGVCELIQENEQQECCTFIPLHTAEGGRFTQAMSNLKRLKSEITENAGKDGLETDWFSLKLGQWGALAVKVGIAVLVVLMLFVCIIPILRKVLTKALVRQMTVVATKKVAEAQMLQLAVHQPDLFPIPDYFHDEDTDSSDSVQTEV